MNKFLLEILDASKILDVPKDSLTNLDSFKMRVIVTGKIINFKVKIGVLVRSKQNDQILEKITANDYNISAIETELIVA